MNRSPLRLGFLLTALALAFAWLGPSQLANAQCPQICDSNDNTAVGDSALISNTTGNANTAIGFNALASNTIGDANTAIGFEALNINSGSSSQNTATGYQALHTNTYGDSNTAYGYQALYNNNIGFSNVAVGALAGSNIITGSNNIALGSGAGKNLGGSDNIDIGNPGVAGDSKTIRIGKQGGTTATYIAGISGATVPTGVAVIVDTTGHLGTTTSSERFKESIKPMDKASEAILALKPVTFRYKHELDPESTPQFGLVAEDVEKVNPDLVARDADGKSYSVRYEAVNAMLLNEFLKEHHTVQELKKEIADLTATVKEQASQIQKVNAQLEVSKPLLQTIANNQ